MYTTFKTLAERPEQFAHADASSLWTTPHIAKQMLAYHLHPETDLASRRPEKIKAISGRLAAEVGLSGKRVLDLGCGPGLYAECFSGHGANVHGLDFSEVSIAYAKNSVPTASFEVGDYLKTDLGQEEYDLITLIYGDICALAPSSRALLLNKVRMALRTGGHFVLDAFSRPQFAGLEEGSIIEDKLMDGFWSADDYVGLKQTLLYGSDHICLDRFTIIEPDGHWMIHNWLKYFDPEELSAEITDAGLIVDSQPLSEDWSGLWTDDKATPFFLIAMKR